MKISEFDRDYTHPDFPKFWKNYEGLIEKAKKLESIVNQVNLSMCDEKCTCCKINKELIRVGLSGE